MDYDFDANNGNLDKVTNTSNSHYEEFGFDNLDRLKVMTLDGNTTNAQSISYTSNGNITKKGEITNYTYSSSKPNAIIGVKNLDQSISQNEQNITYNALQQPSSILEDTYELQLIYGSDGQRITSKLLQNGTLKRTRTYLGDYEKQEFHNQNKTQELHYIAGGDGLAAIYVIENGVGNMYYTYTDYLGSILKITDNSGSAVAEQSFDAWGRRRNASNWSYNNIASLPDWLYRGYTGHEHYEEFALINMNGRMYDPVLGRMLSVDNYVQNNTNTQNFNRYTYALNNPLKYSDPSGEIRISFGNVSNWNFRKFTDGYNKFHRIGMTVGLIYGSIVTGGYIAGLAIPFANTAAIIGGSIVASGGNQVLSGGRSDFEVSFGAGSYNFDNGEFGYLGKNGNSTIENFGYGLGAFANLSDAYGIYKGAFGKSISEVELQSDNHSSLYDKDGNSILDVGIKKARRQVADNPKEAISGSLELSVDYRNHQNRIGEEVPRSIFYRRQSINNVQIDKISAYKNKLEMSGKGYGLLRIFGGCNINCTGGASMALLNAGVFNIPIAVPGILSLQMYARQYSYLSHFLTNTPLY